MGDNPSFARTGTPVPQPRYAQPPPRPAPPPPAPAPATPVETDPARVAAVRRAQRVWTGQLIDLGGRNTLLYYRDQRAGTLDLGTADPLAIGRLLASQTVPLAQLFPSDQLEDATRRARTIRAKAAENFEERGLRTLLLAWGLATWHSERSPTAPAAPVLLRQATLTPRGRAEESFELQLPDEWEVNPTLLQALHQDFQLDIDPDELLARFDQTGATASDPTAVFRTLAGLASEVPGFEVSRALKLGNFSFAKAEMVRDIETGTDALLASDLLCAIAGYAPAARALRDRQAKVHISEPDWVPPADEFLALDADASQSYVINAAVGGSDLVVQGPPGTGKSQTIANLIASLAARGRSVLFVAEKRAAIDAVLDRLNRVGLGDLVLDLHDGVANKRKLAQSLARSLADASAIGLPDVREVQAELERRRADLVRHNDALHNPRTPWGITIYQAQARLTAIPGPFHSNQRLRGPALAALTGDAYRQAHETLRAYANAGGLRVTPRTTPWAPALTAGTIPTPEAAQAALNGAGTLSTRTWPEVSARLQRLQAECGFEAPPDVATWATALNLLDGVAATLQRFQPRVWDLQLDRLAAAMAPAAVLGGASRLVNNLFNRAYRDALKEAEEALRPGVRVPPGELLKVVKEAAAQAQQWGRVALRLQRPHVPADLAVVEQAYGRLTGELRVLGHYLHVDLERVPVVALAGRLAALAGDAETLYRLPELTRLRGGLVQASLAPLVDEVTARDLDVEGALASLEWVWLASILEQVSLTDPAIGTFNGPAATRNVDEFQSVDHRHIASGSARIRRAVAERITAVRDQVPEQSQLVTTQASRSRRFMPIRDLYRQAPDVLGALKPCWAMSPLVVSQLLPMQRCFDVAVFDEASQVTPQDAAGVIARAGRVVVAGDPKQLPPTTFFSTSGGDEEAEEEEEDGDGAPDTSVLSDVESVLDQMTAVLPPPIGTRSLGWHYRSQDERLIAFSNAQPSLYDYAMTTFPGVGIEDPIRHVHVPWRPGHPGEEQSSSDEVLAVVKLVAEHARTRPQESLGVIAMGIKHADRIEETLRRARQDDDLLDAFANGSASPAARREPLFVKNLERVQGDERDAVILSVGYTKSSDGRMQYRWGPLNNQGGERRLNVAITRARRRMTVVSSFTSADLDPARLRAEGARMLGRYLQYAESGGSSLGEAAKEKPDLDPFERDVEAALTRAGIPLVAQWGASGYWIDFVAKHPERPGRMVLAIECDGATYHSSATARDRDRLRQEHLERLGWRFHRIWSTEWFRHRDAEIARAVAVYKAAVNAADATPETAAVVDLPPGAQREESPVPAVPAPVAVAPTRRGPMPVRPGLGSITAYTPRELVTLIQWIESDNLLRTQDELLDEAISSLGFQRRGRLIVGALESAIRTAHRAT